jgi:carbon starvation protein
MNKFARILLWIAVSLVGVLAVLISAFQRGEPVNALWLVVAGVCAFAISYRFYSAWLMAKVLTLDERRAPPAITRADGKDYVPTNKWIVFGHHFAAIAGPGPLVGPVLAAQFGYLPGTLWILIGATLGGGVHDAVVLFASMRREGKSLGRMLREEINPFIGMVAMFSLLAIMTILLAVLGLVVVNALAHSPWGLFTIAATIPLAMAMGLAIRSGKIGVTPVTIVGVIGLLACVVGGKFLTKDMNAALTLEPSTLAWAIIIYGFCASVLPVWLLLAPRDYLSTFMKLGTVALLGLFIIVVAPTLNMPATTQFVSGGGWVVPGPVFPFVCITIACGAISGFHSLISSGTTPKLLQREKHIRMVGYGSMITEMLVSLMAIIAACALQPGQYFALNTPAAATNASVAAALQKVAANPVTPVSSEFKDTVLPAGLQTELDKISAQDAATGASATMLGKQMFALSDKMGEPMKLDPAPGEKPSPGLVGKTGGAPTFAVGMAMMFYRVVGGADMLSLWYHFAIMFEALFILTTLDAGTRVGRFILQDLLGHVSPKLADTRHTGGNVLASALLVSAWGYFLYQGAIEPGGISNSLWPIFGIANQLLAVIAFCLGTTVIIKMGRARYAWVTAIPLAFLMTVTFTAGIMKIFSPSAAGFIPGLALRQKELAAATASGAPAASISKLESAITNLYVDITITALFLCMVTVIVTGCAVEWVRLVRGRKPVQLREGPYVALPEGEAA